MYIVHVHNTYIMPDCTPTYIHACQAYPMWVLPFNVVIQSGIFQDLHVHVLGSKGRLLDVSPCLVN